MVADGYEFDDGLQTFLNVAAAHRLLSAREEQDLARRWHTGDDRARHELVECNIRLVISIARRFRGKGMPLADLIQEGIIGLDRASRKFDPDRGYKFSTYASWWIRQSIQRGLHSNQELIRVPGAVSSRRADIRTKQRDNPNATLDEVAELLEISPVQAHRAVNVAEVTTSLDREIYDEGGSLLDQLPDPNATDPSEVITLSDELRFALSELPDVQRRVIELRFGFEDGQSHGLAEIAERLDIPQSVVRSSQRQALAFMRQLMNEEDSSP